MFLSLLFTKSDLFFLEGFGMPPLKNPKNYFSGPLKSVIPIKKIDKLVGGDKLPL